MIDRRDEFVLETSLSPDDCLVQVRAAVERGNISQLEFQGVGGTITNSGFK